MKSRTQRQDQTRAPLAVSIVVPVYNCERYLAAAIQSVLEQTRQDFELIIVDDGSTDGTPSILRRLSDPRILVVQQRNKGASAARNAGVGRAGAPLIAFLDGDDLWEPTFLARTLEILDSNPRAAAVYTGYRHVTDKGEVLSTGCNRVVTPAEFTLEMAGGNWISMSAVVLRRDAYFLAGSFDEKLRAFEDLDFWLRFGRLAPVIGIPDFLSRYRRHPANSSNALLQMARALEVVIAQNYGDEGTTDTLLTSEQARAFRTLHAWASVAFLGADQLCDSAQHLALLATTHPETLLDVSYWYTLACAYQPLSARGDIATLDLARSAANLSRLIRMAASAAVRPRLSVASRRQAASTAYTALAMLSYAKHEPTLTIQNFAHSIREAPERAMLRQETWRLMALASIRTIRGRWDGPA